jgi:hypothetical protein
MTQAPAMRFDPVLGHPRPYPSHAGSWRLYHGALRWMFNPWTGKMRRPGEIAADPQGLAVSPPAGRPA